MASTLHSFPRIGMFAVGRHNHRRIREIKAVLNPPPELLFANKLPSKVLLWITFKGSLSISKTKMQLSLLSSEAHSLQPQNRCNIMLARMQQQPWHRPLPPSQPSMRGK